MLTDSFGDPYFTVNGTTHKRDEVSGKRLWSALEEAYGSLEAAMCDVLAINYCPLVFIGEQGQNVSLADVQAGKGDRRVSQRLQDICDRHLVRVIEAVRPGHIVTAGGFAASAACRVLAGLPTSRRAALVEIQHPSPRSVKGKEAEQAWREKTVAVLRGLPHTTL
jgi:uracil-DNA glycosylase